MFGRNHSQRWIDELIHMVVPMDKSTNGNQELTVETRGIAQKHDIPKDDLPTSAANMEVCLIVWSDPLVCPITAEICNFISFQSYF